MKRKGFTLVELLVVIAIIALLMGILMPALARVRQIAHRLICGTNLSGIGKAMLIYAGDYDDEFPRAGGRNSDWAGQLGGGADGWQGYTLSEAFGLGAGGSGGTATITSSFYLLVKHAEVTPKSFLCKGDSGTSEFKATDYEAGNRDLITLWDFGPNATEHCSYSYHMPYGMYALTTSSEPGMAVAADRNPWIPSPAAPDVQSKIDRYPLFDPYGSREFVNIGNSISHQEEGQQVLFMDTHVEFAKSPACGINDDNIYTFWDGSGEPWRGGLPNPGNSGPSERGDSFLVHDGEGGAKRECFLADTPVWVDGALVQISKATAGQTVGRVGCVATEQIEKLEEHEGTFECRDITLENGNRISVVDAHCFMLNSGQWVAAQNLQSGMKLKSLKGTVAIKSVVTRAMPFVGKVYNLKVKDSEKYLVGEDGVVVRDW